MMIGGASDRNKADLQVPLLRRRGLGESLDGGAEREELRDGSERRGGADSAQEGAAGVVPREESAHHRRFHDAGKPTVVRSRVVVLCLACVCPATAAASFKGTIRVERILRAHGSQLCFAERVSGRVFRRRLMNHRPATEQPPCQLRCRRRGAATYAFCSRTRPATARFCPDRKVGVRLRCASCPRFGLRRPSPNGRRLQRHSTPCLAGASTRD